MIRVMSWALSAVLAAVMAGAPALLIYWSNESPPVGYATRVILTPRVAPGEKLRISVIADAVENDCVATVMRSIADSFGVIYTMKPDTRPTYTKYIAEITVPLGAAPGPAKYRARVEWKCNPVQDRYPLVILQPELDFEIAPVVGQVQNPMKQGAYEKPGPAQPGTVE